MNSSVEARLGGWRLVRRLACVAMLLSHPIALLAQQVEATPSSAAPQETPSAAPDPHAAMDQQPTLMQLRGFADMQFSASNDSTAPSTFSVGQLDLFMTSQ